MYCVFCTVFTHQQYVNMFYYLLESILIYGNLSDDIHILIYTTTEFMNIIKQSNLYNSNNIKFEINDSYSTVKQACEARLDLFELASTINYDKIFYLDTDMLVKGDLHQIFDLCTRDILYVLKDGTIDHEMDYFGKTLFGNEINNYEDKSAFTSGIMLFKNCETIRVLFDTVKKDMQVRHHYFFDQPFIVYHAFRMQCFDNTTIFHLVKNNHGDGDITTSEIVHHFPGGPGYYETKLRKLNHFLNYLKEESIRKIIDETKQIINEHLLPIIHACGEPLEGNIFMIHHTLTYTNQFEDKVKNICSLAMNKNIKQVFEIGFNAGFSTLLMLIANPQLHITCADLCEHSYTIPCYKKLRELFPDRIFFVKGDSMTTLSRMCRQNLPFDLIHIDGGHTDECVNNDIAWSFKFSKTGTVIIMDDYDFGNIHKCWNEFMEKHSDSFKEVDIQLRKTPYHDVRRIVLC